MSIDNINISYPRAKYLFYLVSIIMLSNGLFFNYIFSGTPLVVWRQVIWIIGLLFFLDFIFKNKKMSRNNYIFKHFHISVFILTIYTITTFIVHDFNLTRLIGGWMFYLYGFSFLVLPFIILKLGKINSLFKFLSYVGLFISVGLVLDSFFPQLFIVFKNQQQFDSAEIVRATFMAESSTVLGISQTFFLICSIYCLNIQTKNIDRFKYVAIIIIYIVGIYFTGSRQIMIPFIVVVTISLLYVFKKNIGFLISIVISMVLIMTFSNTDSFNKVSSASNVDYFFNRLTDFNDGGNSVRRLAWQKGLDQFKGYNLIQEIFGNGLAFTQGQYSSPNEIVGYHMESTFFAIYSEGGIFLIFVFLTPILYLLYLVVKFKNRTLRLTFFLFVISFLFISMVSPNGLGLLASMCLYITIGFSIITNNLSGHNLNKNIQ